MHSHNIFNILILDLCFGRLLEAARQINPADNLQDATRILAERTEASREVATIVREGP